MSSHISDTDIKPGYKTDHSKINLSLITEINERGRGFWKLNCSLLSDKEYVELIKHTITDTVNINVEANPSLIWDTVKAQIRGETIKYASMKKKSRLNKIKEIEDRLKEVEKLQQIDQDPRQFEAEIKSIKEELEREVEYKTKGALIRCKVQWYEEGGKASKYFF